MQTVIFCGGQGTRLREETEFRPKPMLPIGHHPILWHVMKTYAHFGHKDFILPLGYKGEMIREYFVNYRAMESDFTIHLGKERTIDYHNGAEEDFTVTLAETGLQNMTGARLFLLKQYLTDDTFMVTYGDGLCDVNIDELLAFHKSHGKIATVTSVRTVSRFGIFDIEDDGSVEGFAEKPEIDSWINAGYFVFNQKIFDYLSDDSDCTLEQEPLKNLADDKQLMAYKHEGFFFAMDTYREYQKLNSMWKKGDAPWAQWLSESERKAAP